MTRDQDGRGFSCSDNYGKYIDENFVEITDNNNLKISQRVTFILKPQNAFCMPYISCKLKVPLRLNGISAYNMANYVN